MRFLFVTVTPFTVACAAFTNLACIPQQGTSDQLDSLGDRLMFRLAYRNFGADNWKKAEHTPLKTCLHELREAQRGEISDAEYRSWTKKQTLDQQAKQTYEN